MRAEIRPLGTALAGRNAGSALILAVVLVSLLAVVGVVFLLTSRVDSIATSAISENRQLNYAVDTVVAQICAQLAIDVPGASLGGEYYDYPDGNNAWLASLEPCSPVFPNYYWPHITDLYFKLGPASFNFPIYDVLNYQQGDDVGDSDVSAARFFPADADGDGVSDSMWAAVPGLSSSKAKPIYAAIRIIDNGGMLNVNTGFKFDPCTADGSSQMQVNLMALSWRPFDNPPGTYTTAEEGELLVARANDGLTGLDPCDFTAYSQNVIWRYDSNTPYTPFDIADEIEMRNRFVLDHFDCVTRIERWGGEMRKYRIWTPVTSGGAELRAWATRTTSYDPLDPNYAYRHITTTHNIDRIIDPNSERMFNINSPTLSAVTRAIQRTGLDPNVLIPAQITANLMDYIDPDSKISFITDPCTATTYYGFETPCVYISELVQKFWQADPNDPNVVFKSFAVEIHKPDFYDPLPEPNGEWQLVISSSPNSIPITWSGSNRFHVMWKEDPCALLPLNWDMNAPNDVNVITPTGPQINAGVVFNVGDLIQLRRLAPDGAYVTVDQVIVPLTDFNSSGWFEPNTSLQFSLKSYEREIHPHRCIRRLWSPFINEGSATLGAPNSFTGDGMGTPYYMYKIQAHPAGREFINVGQVQMAFYRDATAIGPGDTESMVRFDFTDPVLQPLLNYMTVIDPASHGQPAETRIKGRININTAPWYVLAQLPWVSQKLGIALNYKLAEAITAYRDKTPGPGTVDYSTRPGSPGFRSIGELMNVTDLGDRYASIAYYAEDPNEPDLLALPDLTPSDDAANDFEERDVIFARISNLVTVRSDVFTAYILLRIGRDGPQKRVIAVLDRSKVNPGDTAGKVKVIAAHPVADPR